MERATAEKLVAKIEEINKAVFALLPEFENELSPEEFSILKREVGRMGVLADSNIYPKILFDYPDLLPLKSS